MIFKAAAHWKYGVLYEGHKNNSDDCNAHVVEISNDFSSRKVGSVANLTAQIVYKRADSDQLVLKVNRGAWLSKGNRVSLGVNDTARLIICFAPVDDPFALAFARDFAESQDVATLAQYLSEGRFAVQVDLISEAKGAVYKVLHFDLTITEKPKFQVALLEVNKSEGDESR